MVGMIEKEKLEQAVNNLVMVYRRTEEASKVLNEVGCDFDLLTNISGWTADALFFLANEEDTDNWYDTFTAKLLDSKHLTDQETAVLFASRILQNMEQPAPQTISSSEFETLVIKNGGYFHDAGRDRGNG